MTSELDPDKELRHDVLDALDACDELDGGFGITVKSGVVILTATLPDMTVYDWEIAVRVIRQVPGVFRVERADAR